MPSIATILPKNKPCDTGALFMAFPKWFKFAPRKSQAPSRTGNVATTASAKKAEITTGGDLGSSLKM